MEQEYKLSIVSKLINGREKYHIVCHRGSKNLNLSANRNYKSCVVHKQNSVLAAPETFKCFTRSISLFRFPNLEACLNNIRKYFGKQYENFMCQSLPTTVPIGCSFDKIYEIIEECYRQNSNLTPEFWYTSILHLNFLRFYELIANEDIQLNSSNSSISSSAAYRISRYMFTQPTNLLPNEQSVGVFLVRGHDFEEFMKQFNKNEKIFQNQREYILMDGKEIMELTEPYWLFQNINQAFMWKLSEKMYRIESVFRSISNVHNNDNSTVNSSHQVIKPLPVKLTK